MQRRGFITLALGGLLAPFAPADSAEKTTHGNSQGSGKIAWYGAWKEGLAEAKRTGRPILLIAAAPHCHNVSGLW